MNPKTKMILGICALAAASVLPGCVVTPHGEVDVYAPAPAPAVTVAVYPDYYAWDGYEYVGIVNGRYYYLGPGHVWIVCEPFRVTRFHEWEGHHPDWHARAIRNEHYRAGYERHEDRDYHRDRDRHDRDER